MCSITSDDFFGRIASGRVMSGRVSIGDAVRAINVDEQGNVISRGSANVVKLLTRRGVDQITLESAEAGDIVGVAGMDRMANVTDT